jgi:hypothetical protein
MVLVIFGRKACDHRNYAAVDFEKDERSAAFPATAKGSNAFGSTLSARHIRVRVIKLGVYSPRSQAR